jgi:hypothetical protein
MYACLNQVIWNITFLFSLLLQALFDVTAVVYCLLQQNIMVRKFKTCINVDYKIIGLILWHVRNRRFSHKKSQMMWTSFLTSSKVEKVTVFLSVVSKPLFYIQIFIVAIAL